jgi:hypothetical protein
MLGHRAHNEVLQRQGEALELQTKASKLSTELANEWAYYQSKNTFNLESEIMLDLLKVVAVREDRKTDLSDIVKRYEDTVEYYSGDKNSRVSAKKKKTSSDETEGEMKPGKLAKIEEKARKAAEEVRKTEDAAEAKIKQSHEAHAKADRFDYGELGLQFGVVLCSLAILMRSRGFWIAGIISSAIGAVIALTGLLGLFIAHY